MASNLTDYNNNKKTWIFLWKILLAKLATQSMASIKLISKFPLAIFTYTARKGQWRYTRWHWMLAGTPSTTVVRCCSMNLQQLVSLIPPPSLILQNPSPSSPALTTCFCFRSLHDCHPDTNTCRRQVWQSTHIDVIEKQVL